MSEEILTAAAADRAAELAAIRARWTDQRWRTGEDDNSLDIDGSWEIRIEEPVWAEDRAFLETASHAPADIRLLLTRLDDATAAADAALAEYARYAAEVQAARGVVRAARDYLDQSDAPAAIEDALAAALAAYDAVRPADIPPKDEG